MTIAATPRVAGPFVGNGSTSTFPFTFAVLDPTDIFAESLDLSSGAIDELSNGSDYIVTLNADQSSSPGGSITLVSSGGSVPMPLLSGFTLTVTTARPPAQTVDLTNGGAFYPDVINTALDALTILVQQLMDQVALCLQVPLVDGAPRLVLPAASYRANYLLGFDSAGNVTLSSGGGGGGGGGSATPSAQVATGDVDDSNMSFTFIAPASPTPVPMVFAGGVFQTPSVDYVTPATLLGGTTWQITFLNAPIAGPVTVVLFG